MIEGGEDAPGVEPPGGDPEGGGSRLGRWPRSLELTLHRRDSIGRFYHVLTFEAPGPIPARPGHFAMVRGASWGQAPLLPRPMSLLSGGRRPSILIKVIGDGTTRMAHASPGEPFLLLAPLGRPFEAPAPGRRPILVAGGVGVAPLAFLAQEIAGRGARPLVLFGGRSASDLPLEGELAAAGELRIATEDGSKGARGRVTDLLEAALLEVGPSRAQIYTCGPDRMMAAVARIAREKHVPCAASLETPMACGYGVCLGCPVPRAGGGFLYACTEGPCVDASRIAWERGEVKP